MIVFNLICSSCEYAFEGWFDNSSAFESQKKRKLINCPNCQSSSIKKALVAPNVGKKSNSKKTIEENTLFLSLNESSSFDIYENEKDFVNLMLFKNTGITIPKNTIINSKFNKNVLLIEIQYKDKEQILKN